MEKAQNCWENKKCGREPGGLQTKEFGECPAAICNKADQINNGHNGGRCCWAISGTLCGGQVQGVFALKIVNCMKCDFFKQVWREEHKKKAYIETRDILKVINA